MKKRLCCDRKSFFCVLLAILIMILPAFQGGIPVYAGEDTPDSSDFEDEFTISSEIPFLQDDPEKKESVPEEPSTEENIPMGILLEDILTEESLEEDSMPEEPEDDLAEEFLTEDILSEEPLQEDSLVAEEPNQASKITINVTECELYYLSSSQKEVLTIPKKYPQSCQLKVTGAKNVRYEVAYGTAASVSSTGKIKLNEMDSYSEGMDTYIRVFADNKTFTVKVTPKNYAEIYVDNVLTKYLKDNLKPDMSVKEKVTLAAKFAAGYDYDARYSSCYSMVIYGGGSCWASTDAICILCEKMGLNAWWRNGNKDSGAGSGHVNAVVDAGDGTYYEAEAGYAGTAPRYYSVYQRDTLYNYHTLEDDNLSLIQYDGSNKPNGTFVVPTEYNSRKIVKIEDAFSSGSAYRFTKVKLPNSIREIGEHAFSGFEIREINIPDSVTTIGKGAFAGCENLTTFTCGSGQKYYSSANGVLYNKKKTKIISAPAVSSVSIPKSVTYIGDWAFSNNTKIETLVIPSNVTKIGEAAFFQCYSLKAVTIPASVKTIGEYAFATNSSLTIYGISGSAAETYAKANNIRFVDTKKAGKASKVQLDQSSITLTVDKHAQITASVIPESVSQDVIWSSSDPSVAVVRNGYVYGLKAGTVTLTCKSYITPSKSAVCKVTVKNPVPATSLTMNYKEIYVPTSTSEQQLHFYLKVNNSPKNASTDSYTWTIGNEGIVGQYYAGDFDYGYFFAIAPGTTKITCTANDSQKAKSVCVVHAYDPVTSVKLNKTSISLPVGKRYQLTAKTAPAYATYKTVEWSSSDSTIATVNSKGVVTSKRPGTVTIECRTKYGIYGSGSGVGESCIVTVTETGSSVDVDNKQIEQFVTRLYDKCLGRKPDPSGLDHWVSLLTTKTRSGAQVAYGFVFSKEYTAKNTSDEEYVDMLYRVFMDREGDAGGRKHWLELLEQGVSREYVFRGFVQSAEYTNICSSYGIDRGSYEVTQARDQNVNVTRYVNRMYTQALGRKWDAAGIEHWCDIINKKVKTPEQVAESFINSAEFQNKNLNDEEYIKVLYRTFMGRESDASGLEHWKGELARGCTRQEILHRFATSAEFKNIQTSFGLQ